MNAWDQEIRYILKFYYKKGKNATKIYAIFEKIDILIATTLLKNWMLIIKQFYVIYESLSTRKNLTFGYHMISLRET